MSSRSDYVESAVNFLSQYFGVKQPRVVLNCERTCRVVRRCPYVACYMPAEKVVHFKTGWEQGYIVVHEFGHHLETLGVRENGEPGAKAMEKWWTLNVNECLCTVCGYPLFVADDTPIGREVPCPRCGAVYEAVPKALPAPPS